jgi:DNA polymerase iota
LNVTDIVDYNLDLLNFNHLTDSFFCISKEDPSLGFSFDATRVAGNEYGSSHESHLHASEKDVLRVRLLLGSHLAQYIRLQVEEVKGYTSTVGISTSKLLSKLIGNVNKPRGQTTLMPPYVARDQRPSNVTLFIDQHEIGKIPGIGFKMASKLREHVLQHPVQIHDWVSSESVNVGQLRTSPGICAPVLEKLLAGPGSPAGLGLMVWNLLHGIDDSEVAQARQLPRQISIEDSYVRLTTLDEAIKEMTKLARSLIKRMRTDLVGYDDSGDSDDPPSARWLAHPRTLRLSTRPRLPLNADGTRTRSNNRISRTAAVPSLLYSLTDSVDALAEKLVAACLVSMFRKLHPESSGWNLSLINVAVTNMTETAGEGKSAVGRDISKMFRFQETNLKEWKVEDRDVPPDDLGEEEEEDRPLAGSETVSGKGSEDLVPLSQETRSSQLPIEWQSDDDSDKAEYASSLCAECGAYMPAFAMIAHERYHEAGRSA